MKEAEMTVNEQPLASDCGKQGEPQFEKLAGIGWNCLLSKLFNFVILVSTSQPRKILLEQQSY